MSRINIAILLLALSVTPALAQNASPHPSTGANLLLQAKAAEVKGDFLGAAALYQKFLAAHPNQPQILQRLGLVYYLAGRFDDAIPVFTKAAKLDHSLWGSDLFGGISYYRTGRFSKALSPLRRALRLKPNLTEADFWLGATFMAEGKPESAIPFLKKVAPDARLGVQADSLLVEAYSKAAESYYQRIAKLNPNSYRVHELKAQELAWQGTTNAALLEYQKALNLNPHLEGAHRAMGEIYWQQRQFALAAREFEAELRLNPMDEEANRRLGEYWLAKGNAARAITYLNVALAVHTAEPGEVYHFLGLAELSQRKLGKAEAALKLAIEHDPREPSNYRLLMHIYQQTGKPAQAGEEQRLFEKYRKHKE